MFPLYPGRVIPSTRQIYLKQSFVEKGVDVSFISRQSDTFHKTNLFKTKFC